MKLAVCTALVLACHHTLVSGFKNRNSNDRNSENPNSEDQNLPLNNFAAFEVKTLGLPNPFSKSSYSAFKKVSGSPFGLVLLGNFENFDFSANNYSENLQK